MRGAETAIPCIGVSIVAYLPDTEALSNLLTSLQEQLGDAPILIIDNGGAASALPTALPKNIKLLNPGSNVGVAQGHNLALRQLYANGCSHALLFDQDSVPLPGMISSLLNAEQTLRAAGLAVAAVGPDTHAKAGAPTTGFVRLHGCLARVSSLSDEGLPVAARRCDFLITSGTLLRDEVFAAVGDFDKTLFIDNVDVEWCYRAAHRGHICYGVINAHMQHRLGDQNRSLPFSRRRLVIHSPLRIYYMTRNRLLLYWKRHVPLGWKLADVPRLCAKLLLFVILVRPRRRYLYAGVIGLLDGLRRRGGMTHRNF